MGLINHLFPAEPTVVFFAIVWLQEQSVLEAVVIMLYGLVVVVAEMVIQPLRVMVTTTATSSRIATPHC